MKNIHLISGPRNMSTAIMYSFGNRSDTKIIDEPFYAYYLSNRSINHPGKDEIIQSQTIELKEIIQASFPKEDHIKNTFVKNMAHHCIMDDWSFMIPLKNIILVRHPKRLINSFSKVISNPTLYDIGLKREYDILQYLIKNKSDVIVLDSSHILNNPKITLTKVCNFLEIEFSEKMLKWNPGPRKEDGVWAKYWYHSVHQSTGFTKQKSTNDSFPNRLTSLYEESMFYYNLIQQHHISL